jgi:hypothetical protein
MALAVPVAVFLVVLWALMVRPHQVSLLHAMVFPVGALLVLLAGLTSQPVLLVGLVLAALVAAGVAVAARRPPRA